MRGTLPLFILVPSLAIAEDYVINSKVTDVTAYATGGIVTHEVALTLPAGNHQLILPNLPHDIDLESLRISGPDLKLGAVRFRDDFVPPREDVADAAVEAVKARIREIEERIQGVKDDAARHQIGADAARDRIAFLTALNSSDSLPTTAADLRAIVQMVGEEMQAARNALLEAEIRVRTTRDDLETLEKELKEAQTALAALVPEKTDRAFLAVDVAVIQAQTDTPLRVSYVTEDVFWQPAYDIRLADGDTPELTIDRSALVQQDTSENWEGVRLRLTTQQFEEGSTQPSQISPDLRRLMDPAGPVYGTSALRSEADSMRLSVAREAAAPEPIIMEDVAQASTSSSGRTVTYTFPKPVDVASGADALQIPFDTIRFPAEIYARATPLHDDKAYLMARFTNDGPEPILFSYTSLYFFEDTMIGFDDLDEIVPGQEAELGFGKIDGLQLTRRLLDRAEGDRGIISRSNETSERVEITLENFTNRSWDIELRDRVPYSEQEDLEISYSARPTPSVDAVDDKRGVLQWDLTLSPGQSTKVQTRYEMTWPEGQVVR